MPTVEATLFIDQLPHINWIVENQTVLVNNSLNEKVYYKYLIPESVDHVIIKIDNIKFSSTCKLLSIQVQSQKLPSEDNNLKTVTLYSNVTKSEILYWVTENTWNYLKFTFISESEDFSTEDNLLNFKLQYFFNTVINNSIFINNKDNSTNKLKKIKNWKSTKLTENMLYKQYNLVKESSSDSFIFTYELEEEIESLTPVPINVTNQRRPCTRRPGQDNIRGKQNVHFSALFVFQLK